MDAMSFAADPLQPSGETREHLHRGTVARVASNGVGYFTDDATQKVFVFTFDRLHRYRGEAISELGLKEGSPVKFKLDADGNVERVFTAHAKTKARTKFFAFF